MPRFKTVAAPALTIAALLAMGAPADGSDAVFVPLDFTANAISGDGSTVVGQKITVRDLGSRDRNGNPLTVTIRSAVRWTLQTSLEVLNIGPFSNPNGATAHTVSHDGAIVLGTAGIPTSADSTTRPREFRWIQGDVSEPLESDPDPDRPQTGSLVRELPAGDGAVWRVNEAYRQLPGVEKIGLGTLLGPIDPSRPRIESRGVDISADGRVVVGISDNDRDPRDGTTEAFRWTEEGGMQGLGDLGGRVHFSTAWAVSADGSVVVGQSASLSGTEAFRWTAETGMVGLGDLPGGLFVSGASFISDDGQTIYGFSSTDEGPTPFIWDADHGMRSLQEALEFDFGLDLSGQRLTGISGVSDDGTRIIGSVKDSLGRQSSFFVSLTGLAPAPEPGSVLILTVAGGFLALRRGDRKP